MKLPLPHEPVYPEVKFTKHGNKIVIKNPRDLLKREILRNAYINELKQIILINNKDKK